MRSLILLILAACLCQAGIAQPVPGPQAAYPVLFRSSFDTKRALRRDWDMRPPRRHCRLVHDSAGNRVLRVSAAEAGTYFLRKSLPAAAIAGRKLLIRVRLRSIGTSTPPAPYNGVKVALHMVSAGDEDYPQLRLPPGAFDWQGAGFTALIPADLTSCTLWVGLEAVSGDAFFDDLELRVFPQDSVAVAAAPAYDSSHLQLRGAMIPTFAGAADLRALAALGANHARWQLTWSGFPYSPADTASLAAYRLWLRGALAHVHTLLPLCDSLGLRILLDLHTLPGGRRFTLPGQENRIFTDSAAQLAFQDIWKEIAAGFRSEPAIWGYDLANEPLEGYLPDGIADWQHLATSAAAAIRRIDTVHAVIVEGAPDGLPMALAALQPLEGVGNIVYSLHMYEPGLFTHQGVYGQDTGIAYPGFIGGRCWDKDTLRKALQPARDWQLRHGTSIYVGEFSAVRWAPAGNAYSYLRDCIDLFEEWGWAWAYHAFREWDGWSVEHDGNPEHHMPVAQPTDRLLLLTDAFRKNRRP